MTHRTQPSPVSRGLAYFVSSILVIAFGVSQFASSCGCGKKDTSTRDQNCTPAEWDSAKWQGVKAGQQGLSREIAESAYAQDLAKLVAPYKTSGVWHSWTASEQRGPLILGGRQALAGFESLFDEQSLAFEMESALAGQPRTGFQDFLERAGQSNVEARPQQPSELADELAFESDDELPSDTEPKRTASAAEGPVGSVGSAITDGNGTPVQPTRYPQAPDVALNVICMDGTQLRFSGWIAASRVVVTAGHLYGMAQPHGGIRSIDIMPPQGPTAPNAPPARIPAIAYQVEPAYNHPGGGDDVMMLYFQAALPARAVAHSPTVNYQSVIATGCANPGNCIAQNVEITATGGNSVFNNGGREWNYPAIRTGQSAVYYQQQQGNSQWLYLFPPITEPGDSGGPAFVNGQLIGMVWGVSPIPVNYVGQVNANHQGTVIQLLDGNRLQNMITLFQNNVQNLIANATNFWGNPAIPQAPWRTADQRFGILVDYNQGTPRSQHWTTTTLANALAAFLFFAQWNPPAGGCNHP